jgi:integrase/recombinase XerD
MEGSARSAAAVRLEDYEEGFLAELAQLGYASRSREAQCYLLRHLSRWLAMRGLALSELSEEVTGQYVAARRQERSHLRSERALRPLLGYLPGLGIVPTAEAAVPETAGEVLLARFAAYLAGEQGPAPATVSSYLFQVRPFVAAHADAGRWSSLSAGQIAKIRRAQRRRAVPAFGAGAGQCLARPARLHVGGGPDRVCTGRRRRLLRRASRRSPAERAQPRSGR